MSEDNSIVKMYKEYIAFQQKKRKCQEAIRDAIKQFESETDHMVSTAVPTRKELMDGRILLVNVALYTVEKTKAR